MNANYTISDFRRDLRAGPYAWPGGYPRYFQMNDGEALSFDAARDNVRAILEAIAGDLRDGWQVIECSIHWEGEALICAHSSEEIPSAYGDLEE